MFKYVIELYDVDDPYLFVKTYGGILRARTDLWKKQYQWEGDKELPPFSSQHKVIQQIEE